MMRSMFAAVSGLRNHQTMMDVLASNISNVNTFGYKSQRTSFKDSLYQNLAGAGAPVPPSVGGTNPRQVGLGMALNSIDTLMTQGNAQSTGVVTDMMIQGDGFFRVAAAGLHLRRRRRQRPDGRRRALHPRRQLLVRQPGLPGDDQGPVRPRHRRRDRQHRPPPGRPGHHRRDQRGRGRRRHRRQHRGRLDADRHPEPGEVRQRPGPRAGRRQHVAGLEQLRRRPSTARPAAPPATGTSSPARSR